MTLLFRRYGVFLFGLFLAACASKVTVVTDKPMLKPTVVVIDTTPRPVATIDSAARGHGLSGAADEKIDVTTLRAEALALYLSEKYDEALPKWITLAGLTAGGEMAAEAHYVLGNIFFHKEEYTKAEIEFKQALAADSLYVDAYQDLGLTHFVKGDYDKALKSFRKVLTILPADSEATYWVQYTLGTKAFEEGLGHFNLEWYDQAIAAFKTAAAYLENDTTVNYKIYYFIGKSHYERFEYEPALAAYLTCVKMNPHSEESYTELGNAYFARMEFDKAIAANEKALAINADYAKARNNLGYIYFSLANAYAVNGQKAKAEEFYAKALGLFERALYLDPTLEGTRKNIDHVKKIVQGERNVTAYTMLQAARQSGDNLEKIGQYRKILSYDSTYDDAYNNLGVAYFFEGHADSAMAILETALRINPYNPQAHNNLGYILGTAHRFDEGLKHLYVAIQIKRDYLDAYVNLGYVYMWKEDFNSSRKIWTQLLRINPGNKHARKGLEELERREKMIQAGETSTKVEIHEEAGVTDGQQ